MSYGKNAYKGKYIPKNPQKYRGDHTKIMARSSWETKFFKWCDLTDKIVGWNSEEVIIPYRSPIDNKYHRYFVDATIWVKDKDGNIHTHLIEIKPKSMTVPPVLKKRKTKSQIEEVARWAVNSAKWEAAREYAADRNWSFVILTEESLGITKKK